MFNRSLIAALTVAGAVLFVGHGARASIIALYSFDDGTSPSSVDPHLDSTFDMAVRNSQWLASFEVIDKQNGENVAALKITPPKESNDVSSALDLGSYFELSVKAGAGFQLDLDSLEFNAASPKTGASYGYVVQSSVGGFGSSKPIVARGTITTGESGLRHYRIDLSASQFQGLGEVEFRVYVHAADPAPLTFDDIEVTGDVYSVPEPASHLVWFVLMILIVAFLGWVFCRQLMAWSPTAAATSQGGVSLGAQRREPPRQAWTDDSRKAIIAIIERGRNGK